MAVVAERVAGLDHLPARLGAVASLVDRSVLIDEVVIADVAPTESDGVIVVDRPDGGGNILRVRRVGVVDDDVVDSLYHMQCKRERDG